MLHMLADYLVLALVGAALWAALSFGFMGFIRLTGMSDHDDRMVLGVAFGIAPFAALTGGLVAGAWFIQKGRT